MAPTLESLSSTEGISIEASGYISGGCLSQGPKNLSTVTEGQTQTKNNPGGISR